MQEPAATAVTRPALFTVALLWSEVSHVTAFVRFCVVVSEYVPVAVACAVCPTVNAVAHEVERLTSVVGGGGGGTEVDTVT